MYDPGLAVADRAAFLSTLTTAHGIRVLVDVLDLNHNHITSLGNRIRTGAIQCTLPDPGSPGSTTRAATVEFYDPQGTMSFDSGSPADGALYADRMLQVHYGVSVPGLGWVDVPVFTGPVIKFSRTKDFVTVEAQGKEALARGAAWHGRHFPKNTRRVDIIRAVMRDVGETRFDLPELAGVTASAKNVVYSTVPWEFAQGLAVAANRQLFYDGAGTLRARQWPSTSSATFADGDGGAVQTTPSVEFSIDEVKNAVRVVGAKPKGHKHAISYSAVAPKSHPLSPDRLAPSGGKGLYLLEDISDDKIRTLREAKDVAHTKLEQFLRQIVTAEYDILPNPLVELGDWVTLSTADFTMTHRVNSFTIPLVVTDLMPLGYTRPIKLSGRKR